MEIIETPAKGSYKETAKAIKHTAAAAAICEKSAANEATPTHFPRTTAGGKSCTSEGRWNFPGIHGSNFLKSGITVDCVNLLKMLKRLVRRFVGVCLLLQEPG